jgi:rhodanese-related sulfurtransferase
MRKNVLVPLLIVVAAGLPALAAPRIAVDSATYDFGETVAGLSVTHVFTITNAGDQPLEITGVGTGCGCTTASLERTTLDPGESVPLRVTVNTADLPRLVTKTATVSSTDPVLPSLDLIITGTLVPAEDYQTNTAELNRLYLVLVDLRTAEEYQTQHLMGAVNIPYPDLDSWTDRLPHGVLIVLYDQDGSLSDQAAQTMQQVGFPEARSLVGGLDQWRTVYQDTYLFVNGELPPLSSGEGTLGLHAYPIAVTQLKELLLLVVDLRSQEEYLRSHLVGAINVPYAELDLWMPRLPQDVPLVLYDQDGSLSDQAAQTMRQAGFSQSQSLLGGLDEWTLAYGSRYVLTSDAK